MIKSCQLIFIIKKLIKYLILGLILSYGKGDMPTFLRELYPNLKTLEYGVPIVDQETDEKKDVKLFLLHAIFDKPARASAINIVNSTGYYGCLKCRIKGKSVKTKSYKFIYIYLEYI